MKKENLIVISYDISDNKKRTKIHKILKSYGQWVQYSIFECNLNKVHYTKLQLRLKSIIEPDSDSIRFYTLCEKCVNNVERIGGELPRNDKIFLV